MDLLEVLCASTTLAAAMRATTPLALAALGAMFCERGGIIQLGIEGIMLSGAFTAVAVSYGLDQADAPAVLCVVAGVLGAVIVGAALSVLQAFLVMRLGVEQVVGGIAVNILALGITGLLVETISGRPGNTPSVPDMGRVDIPLLSDIPYVGPVLFQHQLLTYLMMLLVPAAWWVMYRTTFGLRLQAAGDKPEAVESVGLSVPRLQLVGLLASGVLAALAGVYLSLGELNFFSEGMTSGRGFIALAAVIFGSWRPVQTFVAAFLFGYSDAVQIGLQNKGFDIPSDFLLMTPYVITIVALAGVVGRTRAPASIGKAFGGHSKAVAS